MSAGIERLVDWLFGLLHLFKCWFFVEPWEQAVVVDARRGCWDRTVGPGLRWKAPFALENALVTQVIDNTLKLSPQTLTTRDHLEVTVAVVIKFRVEDVAHFLLKVEGAQTALADCVCGPVSETVLSLTWAELREEGLGRKLTAAVRRRAREYGVNVQEVSICDLAASTTVRLIQDRVVNVNPVETA